MISATMGVCGEFFFVSGRERVRGKVTSSGSKVLFSGLRHASNVKRGVRTFAPFPFPFCFLTSISIVALLLLL